MCVDPFVPEFEFDISDVKVENLYLNPPSWYAEQQPDRFRYHLSEAVTSLSPEKHLVHTSKGRSFRYDKCVIATGSTAGLPPYTSPDKVAKTRGVFVYRDISDLDAIISYADRDDVQHAVVVGGGLLGLEAAKAVYDLPTISHVSIINRQAYPLSRQLDADAGEIVLNKIEALGVQVLTNCSPSQEITRSANDESGDQIFTGFKLGDGSVHVADMVIYAIGIKPRDELAKSCGIECHPKGGIVVGNDLQTSATDVYAIGECANWKGNYYGLIAPGIEMADILSFNLTQTRSHAPRTMNSPDLSTKLKLMGVDVASFGDFFADKRLSVKAQLATEIKALDAPIAPRRRSPRKADEPIKCLVYNDPFSSTYKKYIFTADGKHLLGGMMIGDVSDFVKLVAIVKKRKPLEVPPSQFIIGAKKEGEGNGDDLDDDAQVCSCHNVLKGDIVKCIKAAECTTIGDLKKKTRVGTGCGGCMPLVTSLFNAEMKKAGHTLNNNLCSHFAMSRADLFSIVKMKKLRNFGDVIKEIGVDKNALGCEICRPAVGSILSSLYNEHVMKPEHHQNQDTNDRLLANIQRNGTFSVVPRIAAGEITPEGLIAIGQVAKKYNLYTKITGGQRIDMFGAMKDDLPAIWEELNNAGFESGHAYGKSLRTVKSCVGSTWCRYGVGDSVGLAVQLENRYRGVRSPHKFKGGVSGCVRECAEAQGKDFGIIATDKGWNIFVGGNGGANPRHAELLAKDVPPSKVIRIIDRFLAYYIMTADRLQRTARWIENMDGGIEKLRKVILEDQLGICAELEAIMDNLVNTYEDEWANVVKDPVKRRQFKQFVNTPERRQQSELIEERGQKRPADWPRTAPSLKFTPDQLFTPKDKWTWATVAKKEDMVLSDQGTTSIAIKYGDTQLAIYYVPRRGFYATQQMCPHRRAFVLDHGIIGDAPGGDLYVSCPLHKRNFALADGKGLSDSDYSILAFEARQSESGDDIQVLLPPKEDMDAVLGTEKWLIRQAESEALGLNAAAQIEMVGSNGRANGTYGPGMNSSASKCTYHPDWKLYLVWHVPKTVLVLSLSVCVRRTYFDRAGAIAVHDVVKGLFSPPVMSTLFTFVLPLVVLLVLGLTYARIYNYVNYPGHIPRLGGPGVLGFLHVALRYTADAEAVILEGKAKYGDRPFTVPTLAGPVFLLRREFLDKVRSSTDEVLMTTYNYVNRALPSYVPEMLEESILAIEEALRSLKRADGRFEVPVFDTMTHLIARVSNRVVFGLGLCRNEGFLHAIVRFAETLPLMAPFIKWTPPLLRPAVYFVLSRTLGGKREPLKYILPYLKNHFDNHQPLSEATTLVAEHLIKNAPPQETLVGLATRLLNINFGSIHTSWVHRAFQCHDLNCKLERSSIFITQALFEIALLEPQAVQSMRYEVQEALESEGGWTKGAFLKMKKIDSALREVGRVYGLMHFALPRYTMVEFDLGDGQIVPPGYKVAIDMHAVHFNPDVYPDPRHCDLFRFSKLREVDGTDAKYGFATVDNHYLPFGAGRHACAGRFFAAMELKMMIAHIILNFDISYPQGIHTRPKNIVFNGAIVPDTRAKLIFTARATSPEVN
ncbi:Nitrite reductase [NAD(P)H] [Leucoagaricus sp. SymC.cos]|nr:Nitrite reductase [NAD(P)H] [Leucoagaricus sp. SymC.cos]